MRVFIGAENIISPLGSTAEDCFTNVIEGRTGIKDYWINKEKYSISKIDRDNYSFDGSFWQYLLKASIDESLKKVNQQKNLIYVVSSAKGEIDKIDRSIEEFGLSYSVKSVLGNDANFYCVSNACISGLLAINLAYDLIQSGSANTVVVSGIDLVSDFVIAGFKSLFALDEDRCKPYDKQRKGLNLGEAVGTCILSNDISIYKEAPLQYLGGFSNNDANHISGPSRTGEGLKKSVQRAMSVSDLKPDFISAHGTATNYSDGMEAQAFHSLGLHDIPTNSLKSYFGHTLGAAGTIETIISMQGLRRNIAPGTLGFQRLGTEKSIRVHSDCIKGDFTSFLKTCSGFGGGNAAGMIKKL